MISFLNLQKVTEKYADEIHEAVLRVVDSGWYLQGEENRRFEEHYAEYIGTEHCVGCASGLDALSLILRGYKELGMLKAGDEIIVPANTFIATILAITENELVPVLVEPRVDTLELNVDRVEEAVTERTRGVMVVHLYGRCAYTDRLGDICMRHGLLLLEDNAQAHGCMYSDTVRTGSIGNAAAHSFYPGKNLGALGDGGAVTTNDRELADVVRALANYGSKEKYVFEHAGKNSRLDEIQAAVLDVKLRHLDEDNEYRKKIARYYYDNLHNPLVVLPSSPFGIVDHVFHLFPVLCEKRDLLKAYMTDCGIQTGIHYPIPPHKQKCYKEWNELSLPITEKIHAEELSLPISTVMEWDDVKRVVECVNSF